MNINEQIDILYKQGNYLTDKRIYKNILFYYGSILLNKYNFRKENGTNIKYFGITLAMSASGKGFAKDLVSNLLDLEDNGKYPKLMKAIANKSGSKTIGNLPRNTTISLEGTKEGLFKVANAQANSGFGSLNLLADEMGQIISSSSALIEKTKELYDGFYRAKVTKGDEDSEPEENIENIICNMFMFGSPSGVDKVAKEALIRLCHSGLYRRSFIVDIEPKATEINEYDQSIEPLKEYYKALNENHRAIYTARIDDGDWFYETKIKEDQSYKDELVKVKNELFEYANSDIYNELISAEKGSLEMIVNLAYIIAFLEFREEVCGSDIIEAFKWFKETRKSIIDSLTHKRPYKAMYDLLRRGKPLALTEMAEMDIDIPTQKTKVEDEIALLDEICYRKNQRLNINSGKVTRYSIEELPVNKLDKIIIGICIDNKQEKSIDFSQSLMKWSDIKSVVLSKKAQCFTTCHFEPSGKAPNGHRRAESFISGQNLIAFDVDNGMTINEAQELLKHYTYIIYTTKSHRKEKNGEMQGDRFRIVLPTKTDFYVDAEQHKRLYENLSIGLGIECYDVATRNVSRLWFTNSEAEVYENDAELLDVGLYLPSTEASEEVMPMMNTMNEYIDQNQLDKRIEGIYRWFSSNVYKLGRNNTLYRVGKMIKDLGEDYEYHIRILYSNIEPFETKSEIEQIIKGI